MHIRFLIILGLAQYAYAQSKNSTISWSYFWENVEYNPTIDRLTLDQVDCSLFPNIINWVPRSIVFDDYLYYDWANKPLRSVFAINVGRLKDSCTNVKIVIDPQLSWNENFASQLSLEQISQVVYNIFSFCTKYAIHGLVITFNGPVVKNDVKTHAFFSQLSKAFKSNNLLLLGYFDYKQSYTYVRPLVFEFLDQIMVNSIDSNNGNVVAKAGDIFIGLGAAPEKLLFEVINYKVISTPFPPTTSNLLLNQIKANDTTYIQTQSTDCALNTPSFISDTEPFNTAGYNFFLNAINFDDFNDVCTRGANSVTEYILSTVFN